jgi:anti-sigma-K factor RskA
MNTVRAEAAPPPVASADRAQPRAAGGWLGRMFALPRPAIALGAMFVVAAAGVLGYALGSDGDTKQTTTVRAAVAPPGARVTLERDGDSGILRVSGLPQHRNRIYEVWLARGKQVRPAGLFQVDRQGRGAAAIPQGLDGADTVMVSLEPPGGSAQPTSDPLVVTDI